jgi:hypothetical protein
MEPVVIKDLSTALVLAEPLSEDSRSAHYLTVTLEGPDLRASRQVYEGYAEGFGYLADYFRGLADNWRGWQGVRAYESIEHDLRIEATHNGHINLRVVLWESSVPNGWRTEARVVLDAGEALSAAATDVAHLVAMRDR